MQLLVVRHGAAGESADYAKTGKPDATRPLTPEGRAKMKKTAAALKRILPDLDRIATSPYARAVETAAILSRAYPKAKLEEVEELAPGHDPKSMLRRVRETKGEVVAVVGHEPSLSGLLSLLLAGDERVAVDLKKGGACLVAFEGEAEAGGASLLWLLAPGVVNALAR